MCLPLVSSLGLFRNKASVTVCAPVSVQTRALCLLGQYLEVVESLVNTYLALQNLPVLLSDCFFFSFFLFLAALGLRCCGRASPGAAGGFLRRCRRRARAAARGLGGVLVPQAGTDPVSPAFTGGILTTGPPGKSPGIFIKSKFAS